MPALRYFVPSAWGRLRNGPHPDRARQDAETLLLKVLAQNKAWLLAHPDDEFPEDQSTRFFELVERRFRGEPIQYITGETEFFGLPFRVTKDVLIPRPETEHLVEKAIDLAIGFPAPRVVDIGTGSGAIAVALAHYLQNSAITAIDISAAALTIAKENALRNGVEIRFLKGDLLAPVAQEQFELIVSNPPYIPTADRTTLAVEVRDYEPAAALFAGDDGLAIYRRLIPAAFDALVPGGWLVLEIGFGQADAIRDLLSQTGFGEIEFTPDLQGIPRVAFGRREKHTGR